MLLQSGGMPCILLEGLDPTLCPRKAKQLRLPARYCTVATVPTYCSLLDSGPRQQRFSLCLRHLLGFGCSWWLMFPLWDDKLQLCLVPPLTLVLLPALVTTTRHITAVCESVEVSVLVAVISCFSGQ